MYSSRVRLSYIFSDFDVEENLHAGGRGGLL